MNSPLVSIAIPAYKKEWLREAIESVISQSYPNWELLIVDDHSPFNLKDIVSSYLSDGRIKYYYNEENLGKKSIVYNWNHCLDFAHGDFFVLLCDDDILKPNFVSTLLSLAEMHPYCNVFHAKTELWDSVNNSIIGISGDWDSYENSMSFIENTINGRRKHTITEFLLRTDVVRHNGGYVIYPAGFYSDDVSILNFMKDGGIYTSNEVLVRYRKSEINISTLNAYNVEKVKAALLYYSWLNKHASSKFETVIINRLDYDLYEFLSKASNVVDAIKILLLVPNNVWPITKKIFLLLSYLHKK